MFTIFSAISQLIPDTQHQGGYHGNHNHLLCGLKLPAAGCRSGRRHT